MALAASNIFGGSAEDLMGLTAQTEARQTAPLSGLDLTPAPQQPTYLQGVTPYLGAGLRQAAETPGWAGVGGGLGTAGGAALGGAFGSPEMGSQIGGGLGSIVGSVLDYYDEVEAEQAAEVAAKRAKAEERRWQEIAYQRQRRADQMSEERHDLQMRDSKAALKQAMLQQILGQYDRIAARRGAYTIPSGVSAGGTQIGSR